MPAQYTVNDLILKIQDKIDTLDYGMALKYCKKALEVEPENLSALELAVKVEMELQLLIEAKQHLLLIMGRQTDPAFDKYMYLGQLSVEKEAIAAFQKGVELMVAERNSSTTTAQRSNELASKISTALCAMTEIYLTDCCFEPEAEKMCEEYLNQAQHVDSKNPVVYQMLASVRLSQNRKEEAEAALRQSLSLWLVDEADEKATPSYEERISLVRLLLELSMFDEAFQVLEGLQKEDDQAVDLWYLYGWTYYCLGDDETQTAEERNAHWENARECLDMAVKLYEVVDCDDEALLSHAQELLVTINEVVPPSAPEDEYCDDDDDGNNDDDQDIQDDEMLLHSMDMSEPVALNISNKVNKHRQAKDGFDSDNEDDAMEM